MTHGQRRSRRAVRIGAVGLVLVAVLAVSTAGVAGGLSVPGQSAGPPPADAASNRTAENASIGIDSVSYSGVGVIRDDGETIHLFTDEPHRIDLNLQLDPEQTGRVCVEPRPVEAEEDEEFDSVRQCKLVGADEDAVESVTFRFEEWPGNWTGESELVAWTVAADAQEGEVTYLTAVPVQALNKDEDLSGSGLTNAQELAAGTDFDRADTAGNGLRDGEEVRTFGTDPLEQDTAGNGIPDGIEVLLGTDPTDPWTPPAYLLALSLSIGVLVSTGTYYFLGGIGRLRDGERGTPVAEAVPDGRGSGAYPGEANQRALSDERIVLELLAENGGRMKQWEIVEEVEWSKSKVSRLVSTMAEEGHVEKIRLGRENVIALEEEWTSEE